MSVHRGCPLRHPAGVLVVAAHDLGRWQVIVRAGLRRLCRPAHGVRVEAVDLART
ncbi:MAG: hypothetical protein ACRDO8_10960 [Nocardioidaceae bacterium]